MRCFRFVVPIKLFQASSTTLIALSIGTYFLVFTTQYKIAWSAPYEAFDNPPLSPDEPRRPRSEHRMDDSRVGHSNSFSRQHMVESSLQHSESVSKAGHVPGFSKTHRESTSNKHLDTLSRQGHPPKFSASYDDPKHKSGISKQHLPKNSKSHTAVVSRSHEAIESAQHLASESAQHTADWSVMGHEVAYSPKHIRARSESHSRAVSRHHAPSLSANHRESFSTLHEVYISTTGHAPIRSAGHTAKFSNNPGDPNHNKEFSSLSHESELSAENNDDLDTFEGHYEELSQAGHAPFVSHNYP